ncbi:MAG: hypothetical protein NC098_04020 [Lachnoclostridium sp.]|nr:hypothetical protein [Lachnoclostridium sp.]
MALLSCVAVSAREKSFNFGEADVRVTFEGLNDKNLSVFVETCPVFAGLGENKAFKLSESSDSVFTGKVTLEQEEEIVGITIYDSANEFGFPTVISQGENNNIVVKLDDNGQIVDVISDHTGKGESPVELSSLSGTFWQFVETDKYITVPDSLYNDWHKVRDYEINVMLKKDLASIQAENLPDWFINSLLMRFASLNYTPYTAIAQRQNSMTVEEPPVEAYSWLSTIDDSPMMLKHLPSVGLKPYFSTILRFVGGGLEPIGEQPVAEWKNYAAQYLSPAISNPSELTLDLLSAMSYILQIEKDNRPLSAIQIENLKNAYPDDLDKIVLDYNDQLLNQIKAMSENAHDLSETDFDLMQYIDSEYPGKAVAVDLWNTWCGPCISAMQQIDAVRGSLPDNVIYLYISDTSSDFPSWQKMSPMIHGVNLRISKEDSLKIGEAFSLTGFPSYLFFNPDHSLLEGATGFMGLEGYKERLEQISSQR